jgi:hypothetical protein
MPDYDSLKAEVEKFVRDQEVELQAFSHQMEEKIAAAKQDELLTALKAVTTRLDKIEKRLPPEEDSVAESLTTVRGR